MTRLVAKIGMSCAIALGPTMAIGQAPAPKASPMKCETGPLKKTYGNNPWLVYSCTDDRTVVIISAPGNSAMPSLFAFHPDEKGYQLKGMGNGPKGPTDAALNELRTLTAQDIKALLEQTKAVKGK